MAETSQLLGLPYFLFIGLSTDVFFALFTCLDNRNMNTHLFQTVSKSEIFFGKDSEKTYFKEKEYD